MTTENIKVFCRIRPVVGLASLVEYDLKNETLINDTGTLQIFVPETARSTHNKAASYEFTFNQIFDQNTDQEEVYQTVARPILDNALLGYNGTVFVYGQTATGKTYTIIGEEAAQGVQKQSKTKKRKQKVKPEAKKIPSPPITVTEINGLVQEVPAAEVNQVQNPNAVLPGEIPDPNYVTNNPTPESEIVVPDIPETYGVVPRTLSYIFSYLAKYGAETKVKVAYYEIYKEHGYDLLSGFSKRKRAEDLHNLTEIKAMTDGKHNLHMKNLSRHQVADVDQALELLEHGNANRQVAETHLNEASSRSHSIFTIYLTLKQPETETVLKPKIHLVDLAGSERIGKHHEKNEKIMAEGKNINLSLHHLQQVIVALSRKKAAQQRHKHHHVPYRNSTMTLVLRDSLGGNSCTAMIATISIEEKNLDESISTCRFAQTVATITNKMVVNQIEDADIVIAKLKLELEMAKQELENAVNPSRPITTISEDDRTRLLQLIREYLQAEDDDEILDVGYDQSRIQFCFSNLKQRLLYEREQNYKLQGLSVQGPSPQQPQSPQSQPQQPPQSQPQQLPQSQPQPQKVKSKACIIL